jgi:RNA-directed DNA polymerase
MMRTSSLSEKPVRQQPRRLADWLNPTGARKVHSLVDKVYKRKNLEIAWERVKANKGAGGIDGQSIEDFEKVLDEQLDRLHRELKEDTYIPQPVRQHLIPKAGQPGKFRKLGIPTIYDRVCQQALKNRLEPIFDPLFDDANFGYRSGRSTKDALRKIWREIEEGNEWIVDADLRDFFRVGDSRKANNLGGAANSGWARTGNFGRYAEGRMLREKPTSAHRAGDTARWGNFTNFE